VSTGAQWKKGGTRDGGWPGEAGKPHIFLITGPTSRVQGQQRISDAKAAGLARPPDLTKKAGVYFWQGEQG